MWLGRLRRRAEHAPRVRRMALRVEPREVVVADDREVEAGLFGEDDVAHQLLRTGLLAHHRVADLGHRVPPCCSSARVTTVRSWSPRPSSTTCCHSSARQAKSGEPVVVGRLEGEVHVLERERQRELRREVAARRSVAAWPPATETRADRRRGRRPPSRSRAPTGGRGRPRRRPLRPANASQVLFTTLSRDPARPGRPRSCAGRARRRAGATRERALVGPRREDRQLALRGRVLASRHRCVDEHDVGALAAPPGPRRARSRPRRSCSSAPRSRPERAPRACPGRGRST